MHDTIELEGLVEEAGRRLERYVGNRVAASDVDDIVSEVYVAAIQSGDRPTMGWLLTVASRRSVDHWRRHGRQQRLAESAACEARRRRAVTTSEELSSDIAALLAGLPERQRLAVELYYLEGYSLTEVAERVGTSYRATESLLARARRAMRAEASTLAA